MDLPPPPPPSISHPGIMAIDITEQFAAAVSKLRPGDLIKDDHFTLFEAVSALEIMDPKMDSGCLKEGEELDEEYDLMRDLLPEEILGIIDQLLCLEMAWHMGYPLSQTLLTSVYVESLMKPHPLNINEANFTRDPDKLSQQPAFLFVLRAYCLGLLKACCFVNGTVKDELYFEEEDFVTNTYDRHLLYDISAEPIVELLQQARVDLRSMGRDVSKEVALALDLRLELRIAFLRAIDLIGLRQANPDSLKTPWIQLKSQIDNINKQHGLGKPVPEAFSLKLQRRLASTMPPRPIVQPSFEEAYHQFKRLFQDAYEMVDVLKYSDPQSLLNFVSSFHARKPQPLVWVRTLFQSLLLKDMVVLGNYSIRQILDHDLSITVLPCGRQIDPQNDAIELTSDPRHQISAQMELFRQRVAEAYFDLFRLFCQNRCRVRRTLCHSIQEWDLLQVDVEEIDQLMQVVLDEKPLNSEMGEIGYSLPLSSWAYLYKLRQMEWIVQLGFELSIYQRDEMAGMYWYLNHLAKTRAQHGDRIKSFVTRALNDARGGSGSINTSSTYSTAKDREFMRSLSYIRATMLDAACTWEFADGLSCLFTVLQRIGLLLPRSVSASAPTNDQHLSHPEQPDYTTEEHRYAIRMKPFATMVLPPLPAFDDFKRSTTRPETASVDLLRYAETAVGGARKGFEALGRMSETQAFAVGCHGRWNGNVRDCLQAAVDAGLTIQTLLTSLEEGLGTEKSLGIPDKDANDERHRKEGVWIRSKYKLNIPTPGEGHHDWWIVPKLVPITSNEGGDDASRPIDTSNSTTALDDLNAETANMQVENNALQTSEPATEAQPLAEDTTQDGIADSSKDESMLEDGTHT